MSKLIGHCNCHLCGEKSPVKEQKNGYAMTSCGWCGVQVYARGEDSDAKMRAKMTPAGEPKKEKDPPAPPAPAPKKKPASDLLNI